MLLNYGLMWVPRHMLFKHFGHCCVFLSIQEPVLAHYTRAGTLLVFGDTIIIPALRYLTIFTQQLMDPKSGKRSTSQSRTTTRKNKMPLPPAVCLSIFLHKNLNFWPLLKKKKSSYPSILDQKSPLATADWKQMAAYFPDHCSCFLQLTKVALTPIRFTRHSVLSPTWSSYYSIELLPLLEMIGSQRAWL